MSSRLIVDCERCRAPMPLGRSCPHCGGQVSGGSLRTLLVRFAMLGAAACSNTAMVPYGIAPTQPCENERVGVACACGAAVCACNDAGKCAPYTQEASDGG